MKIRTDPLRSPIFDPEIITRHISVEWIREQMEEGIRMHAAGEKRHFHDQLPKEDEIGTDKALAKVIPHLPPAGLCKRS